MAQGESDFARNYQRAIDTADPATFALLQPPSKELGWFAEAALFVGSVAIGIGVGLLTANPLLGAMAAGAASNLFDYGARGLLHGEQLSWSGAFQSAALGAGTLVAFKLAAFGARLIGRLVTTATSLVYRGGTALLSGAGRLAGSAVSVPRTARAVESGLMGDIQPAAVVRQIEHGELVSDLGNELKRLTFQSRTAELPLGLEHAVVSRADGTRWLVRGGEGGINFEDFEGFRRLLVHTHGMPTGPSPADFRFIMGNEQMHSYIIELGNPNIIRFNQSGTFSEFPLR
jgi:hypothetical protein